MSHAYASCQRAICITRHFSDQLREAVSWLLTPTSTKAGMSISLLLYTLHWFPNRVVSQIEEEDDGNDDNTDSHTLLLYSWTYTGLGILCNIQVGFSLPFLNNNSQSITNSLHHSFRDSTSVCKVMCYF